MNRENSSVSKHEREPSGHVLTRLPLSSAVLCSGVNFAAKLRLTLDAPDFFYLKKIVEFQVKGSKGLLNLPQIEIWAERSWKLN